VRRGSVRVLVNVLEILFVDVRVGVGLPVVAVFMLVLNVFVIVQDMRVRMRHIPMSVLMAVLHSGHRLPPSS
jgi:hypothetical protein